MESPPDRATYRIRRESIPAGKSPGYRHTLVVSDEDSGLSLATCDLAGRAVFGEHAIVDESGHAWLLRANRKVMPSRWILRDPSGSVAMNFDQNIAGKLLDPTHRVLLALVDSGEAVAYRLIDPRPTVTQRMLGLGPDEWALMQDDRLAAKLVRLPAPGNPSRGLLGKLKAILATADRGLVSVGRAHAVPAPVVLAVVMLLEELVDEASG